MTPAFVMTLLTLCPTATPDDIARGIVESGHKKVGVVPTVIYRRGEEEATVSPLGPRGKVMASSIYDALIRASQSGQYRGKFQVVPERIMRSALKSRSLDDLGDPRKIQELARDVGGADGFLISTIDEDLSKVVVRNVGTRRGFDIDNNVQDQDPARTEQTESGRDAGTDSDQPTSGSAADDTTREEPVDDQKLEETAHADDDDKTEASADNGKELDKKDESTHVVTFTGGTELVDSKDGVVENKTKISDDLTLTKAAYQGHSWELRRWNGRVLDNRGIELEGKEPFGMGSAWERVQWTNLKSDLTHPSEDATFPYPVSVKVEGQVRKPIAADEFRVVELNADEEFRVVLKNDSSKGVYVALYVDGLNSINQLQVEPDQLELSNHWHVPAGREIEIEGWHEIKRDERGRRTGQPTVKMFRVVGRGESVAAGQSFEDNIGMITAIFYSVGLDNVQQPTSTPRALPQSVVGVGEGGSARARISSYRGDDRGLMLASWTFHYRTKEQIAELKSGTSNDLALNSGTSRDRNTGDTELKLGDQGKTGSDTKNDETKNKEGTGTETDKKNEGGGDKTKDEEEGVPIQIGRVRQPWSPFVLHRNAYGAFSHVRVHGSLGD
jgi:putative lipoic acid-binding regulatory protein